MWVLVDQLPPEAALYRDRPPEPEPPESGRIRLSDLKDPHRIREMVERTGGSFEYTPG